MDTEEDKDRKWIDFFKEQMRIAIMKYNSRRIREEEEKALRRSERRKKRREERKQIKENIMKQKKVWKLAQDRAWAAKIKDRRYRKKMKWLKKRNWIPLRIFILIFWVRPIKMLMCDAPQVFNLGLLSIEFHVSISRSRKKKKKISS
ncbi:hypothetical protein B9Z55_020865 [Caenorhabditis nigoni]|uniref:Uncharacterized protein n=1 Tax=Caenorhabditis nigoni TaxID=1611254 RepID=A0A2G5TPG5_9PELO|nr:hypothetical protein B9Z55_020865 [Caenorhabditis nigoni]